MSEQNESKGISGAPFVSGLSRLTNSTKAIVVVIAIVCVTVLAYVGKIESAQAVEFLKWALLGFLGAVAIEDGASKLNGGAKKKAGGLSPAVADALAGTLLPLLKQTLDKVAEPAPSSVEWTELAPQEVAPPAGQPAAVVPPPKSAPPRAAPVWPKK